MLPKTPGENFCYETIPVFLINSITNRENVTIKGRAWAIKGLISVENNWDLYFGLNICWKESNFFKKTEYRTRPVTIIDNRTYLLGQSHHEKS